MDATGRARRSICTTSHEASVEAVATLTTSECTEIQRLTNEWRNALAKRDAARRAYRALGEPQLDERGVYRQAWLDASRAWADAKSEESLIKCHLLVVCAGKGVFVDNDEFCED